ncbi:MAG: dockerin type I domain-containing protein, partial [Anaerolineae bacterium]|nr:dockerin type I domain-containing protein [Anaerolineae bacterium]
VSADGTGFQPANLGEITLLAGDVNGDNIIDIVDLAYIAQHYRSADPSADFNADGKVSIIDLALAAGNYQQKGPLTAWR